MDDKYKLILNSLGDERVKLNEKISPYTFTKLKLIADCFYIATNINELIKILDLAESLEIPFMVLGGGTKIFSGEKKFKGLVIKNRSSSLKIAGVKGKIGHTGLGVEQLLINVDSGVSIGKLNDFLIKHELEDIRGFSSLNSSVGGSIFVDPFLLKKSYKIKVWNKGTVFEITSDSLRRDYIIISVIFRFKTKNDIKAKLRYNK